MDKLDSLVTQHLVERLLAPERLTAMLTSLARRRAERTTPVQARIHGLEAQALDADTRLRRLYKLVEDGFAILDEVLKERLARFIHRTLRCEVVSGDEGVGLA
jgi:hypothetical protein